MADAISLKIRAAYEGAKAITQAGSDIEGLAASSVAAEKELKNLQKQSADIASFKKLSTELQGNEQALKDARRRMEELGKAVDGAVKPSAELRREYKAAQSEVNKLESATARQVKALAKQQAALGKAGIDTKQLDREQGRLKGSLTKATSAAEKQRLALKAQAQAAARLADIQERTNKSLQKAANLSLAANAASRTASTLLGPLNRVIEATREQERVEKQLEARLISTGGAAGLSAEQLKTMAGELQGLTLFGDEATIGMQTLLLTFTQIKGAVFKEATQTILDMSTALGTDLKGSAIQVGKALNDPIKGVSALAEVGVSFTQQQKDVIASLVKTGDVAGAQRVILAELQVEFGGAAKAAADTFGGALTQLQNTVGDLFEARTGLPAAKVAIQELTRALADPATLAAVDKVVSGLVGLVAQAATAATGVADFVAENAGLVEGLGATALGIGAVSAVLSPLLTLMATGVTTFALFNGSLGTLVTRAGAASVATASIGPAATSSAAAVGLLSKALRLTPWGLAIAGAVAAIGNLIDATEQLNKAERSQATNREVAIASLRQVQDANSDYATELIKSADAVLALSATEQKSYLDRLEKARLYYAAVREEARLTGDAGAIQRATAEAAAYEAALKAAKASLATLAEPVPLSVIEQDIAKVSGELRSLVTSGKSAKAAIGGLVEGLDFNPLTAGVQVGVAALQQLVDEGTLAADVVGVQLGDALAKLSGEELLAFQDQAVAAFGGAKASADELALALAGSLNAALKQLGIEADKSSEKAGGAFAVLAGNATATAAQIRDGLLATLAKLDNQTDLAQVRAAITGLAGDARLTGPVLTSMLASVDQKARELAATLTGELADAFTRMGIKSRDELAAIAEQARRDYKTIKDSGLATSASLAKAAGQYLDAERAAHDGVLPLVLDVTRAQEDLAKASAAAGDAGAAAGARIADGMREAAGAAKDASAAIAGTDAAANAARGGFGGSGGALNTGQFSRVAATGDAQAIAEFNAFLDSGKVFANLTAQLDATNAAADKAIAGAERRARAAQASSGSANSSSTGAAAFPAAGGGGVVVVRVGDVAPQVSDADLADRVTRQLGLFAHLSN